MSGGWLDIQDPLGNRREPLLDGLTRIGGPGADIVVAEASADQLHLWNSPPRILFMGRGQPPSVDGRAFAERSLRPGDRFQWGPTLFVYGGEAAPEDLASLEELEPTATAPASSPGGPGERIIARVRAGLASDLGLADTGAQKRWRQAVVEKRFDADLCARELLPRPLGSEAEMRMLERSGSLLRDFLMAPLLSGASRRVRETSRGLFAFLLAQGFALLIFAGIVAAALLLIRAKGTSIDGVLDLFLPG